MRRVWQWVRDRLRPRVFVTEHEHTDRGGVPCWCGNAHKPGFWHDPTYGRIDRDIQDKVRERYGDNLSLAQREAIESTAQSRRDRGLSI